MSTMPHNPRRIPLDLALLAGSVVFGVLAIVIGAPVPVVVAVVAVVAAGVLFRRARRSLRRASTQIDTILREELDEGRRDVSFLEEEELPQRSHRQG